MATPEELKSKPDEAAAVFRALADPTRLKLIRLLCRQRDPDALCVNALAELLGVTQSAVSQHLRILKAIGLVKGERRGYHIHYFIENDALEKLRKLALMTLSSEGSSRATPCNGCGTGPREKDARKK